MGNTNNTNEQDTEFALCTVPENERKSYFSLTIVWTGFVFVITSMMAGGGLSAGLDFKGILLAVVLGNVFLSIIAVAVSYIASKTGLTFALLTKYSFGEKGSRVASMFVPVVNIGWYTIQAATYGHFIAQDGSREPDVQADPLDAQMPFWSSIRSMDSPSMNWKLTFTLFGRRFTLSPFSLEYVISVVRRLIK